MTTTLIFMMDSKRDPGVTVRTFIFILKENKINGNLICVKYT